MNKQWNISESLILKDLLYRLINAPRQPIPDHVLKQIWDIPPFGVNDILTVSIDRARDKKHVEKWTSLEALVDMIPPAQKDEAERLCKLLILRGWELRKRKDKKIFRKLEQTIKQMGG